MKSRFMKSKQPAGLMLTSLLDMFTIILIFLIVSFEAEDYDFQLNEDLTLPESTARSVFKPAVNMAITPNEVIVEKKKVLSLQKPYRFSEEAYANGEIPELKKVLDPYYKAWEARQGEGAELVEGGEEDDEQAIILIQADRQLDYKTLYLVLRTASLAGFHKYRLAIMKK